MPSIDDIIAFRHLALQAIFAFISCLLAACGGGDTEPPAQAARCTVAGTPGTCAFIPAAPASGASV